MSPIIRPARPADVDFMAPVLVAAAHSRPDGRPGRCWEILRRPEFAHYITGWPRTGDIGVITEADRPVGPAWARLPADDPGYGFIDLATPELSIGVVKQRRGERSAPACSTP